MRIKDRIKTLLSRWKILDNERDALLERGKELGNAMRADLDNYHSRGGFHIKNDFFKNLKELCETNNTRVQTIVDRIFSKVIWYRTPTHPEWRETWHFCLNNCCDSWTNEDYYASPIKLSHIIQDIFRFYPAATSFVLETYDSSFLSILIFTDMDMLTQMRYKIAIKEDAELMVSLEDPNGYGKRKN